MAYTPQPGMTYFVTTGGTAIQIAPPGVNGGYVVNPANPVDQGFSASTLAEDLFISPVAPPSLAGNNTTVRLAPGQSFTLIAQSTLGVWANAGTSGHKFTVVFW